MNEESKTILKSRIDQRIRKVHRDIGFIAPELYDFVWEQLRLDISKIIDEVVDGQV